MFTTITPILFNSFVSSLTTEQAHQFFTQYLSESSGYSSKPTIAQTWDSVLVSWDKKQSEFLK